MSIYHANKHRNAMAKQQPYIKILHICNDFSYSKVHSNLYKEIDRKNITQAIFHPLRNKSNIGNNTFVFEQPYSTVVYSRLMRKYMRIFFRHKIRFLYNSLKSEVNLIEISIQHATTLFSDGAIAYEVYKKYNTPYIVTVRNTDINTFLKYRPDLYSLGLEILTHASKIIFISPISEKMFFKNTFYKTHYIALKNKIEVIYNGIDEFWHENLSLPVERRSKKFLYIGRFDSNKNVGSLIKAMNIARETDEEIELTLVGGGGNMHDRILKSISKKSWIQYLGPIYDKCELLSIFRSHDYFAMTSIYETFGLVYIEALSQGLPILFSKDQGVDGVFVNYVGIATKPKKPLRISEDILSLVKNRNQFVLNIQKINFEHFNWDLIANKYVKLYKTLCSISVEL